MTTNTCIDRRLASVENLHDASHLGSLSSGFQGNKVVVELLVVGIPWARGEKRFMIILLRPMARIAFSQGSHMSRTSRKNRFYILSLPLL